MPTSCGAAPFRRRRSPRPVAPTRGGERPIRRMQHQGRNNPMLTRRTLLGALSAIAMLTATAGGALAQENYDIALISKGFQHQFWQAVKAGADKAAAEFGVTVTFEGPESESQVDRQMDMLAAALSRGPDAIGFAALDSQAATPLRSEEHTSELQS